MVEQRCGCRSRKLGAFILNHKPIAEKSKFQMVWVFKLSSPGSSGISSSTRTHVLHSMHHQLETKYPNGRTYEGLPIQNTMPPVTILLPISSRLSTCTSVPGSYVGAEDLNSDLHTCSPNSLPHVAGQWWCTPLILALQRQRWVDLWVWGQPALQGKQPGLHRETLCLGEGNKRKCAPTMPGFFFCLLRTEPGPFIRRQGLCHWATPLLCFLSTKY